MVEYCKHLQHETYSDDAHGALQALGQWRLTLVLVQYDSFLSSLLLRIHLQLFLSIPFTRKFLSSRHAEACIDDLVTFFTCSCSLSCSLSVRVVWTGIGMEVLTILISSMEGSEESELSELLSDASVKFKKKVTIIRKIVLLLMKIMIVWLAKFAN